jgi:hypothetical protein
MNYPPNSREISFLSTAECKQSFAALVRALDKEDEKGTFGAEGWRARFRAPAPPAKSQSGEYRDSLAATHKRRR